MHPVLTAPFHADTSHVSRESDQYAKEDVLLPTETQAAAPAKGVLSVITRNVLFLTALSRCLDSLFEEFSIEAFDSVEDWSQAQDRGSTVIVLLCATGADAADSTVSQNLDLVAEVAPQARTIVISDVESPSAMIAALKHGAKGYVPMSLDLEVAIGAIKLVNVGGTFVPASGLLSFRSTAISSPEVGEPESGREVLTRRQITVLEYLRQGDPNKLIAHKLNMSEATVKIHVRNMMKKIQARNRTELVNLTKHLF